MSKQPTNTPAMREKFEKWARTECPAIMVDSSDRPMLAEKCFIGGYQAALPSDAEIEAIARRKVDEILSPDPNHPEDDTYHLQFPHAVEEVEGRDFWRKHLTELFVVFLREELRGE